MKADVTFGIPCDQWMKAKIMDEAIKITDVRFEKFEIIFFATARFYF